jgi:hypothetical protein
VCILNFFARTQHALKKNKMATISLNLQNQFFSQFLSRLPSTHIGFISVQKSKSNSQLQQKPKVKMFKK